MQINVSFDSSVSGAPSGFVPAINYVVNYLDNLFTNNVTINIDVGYGEVEGQTLASNALGESLPSAGNQPGYLYTASYSAVKNALLAQGAPGASTLPSTSPLGGTVALTAAEAKALNLISSNAGPDGYVGFSSAANMFSYGANTTPPSSEYYFIGVAEHEITEVMGRISLIDQQPSWYDPMDLFRYTSPGQRDTSTGGTGSTAYFSVDSGSTNLGTWNNNPSNGDLGDWYPQGPASGGHDAFNDYSYPGVVNQFSASDVTLMQALGWTTAPPLQPPVVTASSVTVPKGQVLAVSNLISTSDPNGLAITQYTFRDTGVPGSFLAVNGIQQAANQNFTVSNLSQLTYHAGLGADVIWAEVSDGSMSSAWVSFTVTGIDTPPVVTVTVPTVTVPEEAFSASGMFAATDPDGDTVTQLHLWDTGSGGAYFTFNGTPQPLKQNVTVTPAQLGQVSYHSGLGRDVVWVQASDGTQWSAWQSFTVIGAANAPGTVVVAVPSVATHGQAFSASTLVPTTDTQGSAILSYNFWDTGSNGAYFTLNGTQEPWRQNITVSPTQLSQLSYHSGSGSDVVWVQAYNGTQWGSWESFTVNGVADTPPTVTASNEFVTNGQTVLAQNMITAHDADGDTITQYNFWDTGSGGAFFTTNSTVDPLRVNIPISATQLQQGDLTYHAGSGSDVVWAQAFDGTLWGAWVSFTVNTLGDASMGLVGGLLDDDDDGPANANAPSGGSASSGASASANAANQMASMVSYASGLGGNAPAIVSDSRTQSSDSQTQVVDLHART